jgi:hypothetical protein
VAQFAEGSWWTWTLIRIDNLSFRPENTGMNTNEKNEIPPDLQAELQAVIEHAMTGKPLDPDMVRRIRERSEKIQEELFQKYGILDIGVPAIRELRGELPEP